MVRFRQPRRHIGYLTPNDAGKDFFVGDIHGKYRSLMDHLDQISFNISTDRLISVGDLIDRGPQSYECLKLIEESWFFSVLGNHEFYALNADIAGMAEKWRRFGGAWFDDIHPQDKERVKDLVADLPYIYIVRQKEGKPIVVAHAELPATSSFSLGNHALSLQDQKTVLWSRKQITARQESRLDTFALSLHGHTPLEAAVRLGDALFIDTGHVYGGPLTILSADSALDYQSS